MTEAKRPLKVFLCHAHSDKDAVKALYTRLTNDGVDAWLDKEKLLPGQDWELEIRKAVREADVVVVCLSKQFNQRGFRQKEVRLALDTAMEMPEGEIFIIPARLEECDNLESLRKWHWVDLFEENGYEMLLRALRARADKIGATLQIKKKQLKISELPSLKANNADTDNKITQSKSQESVENYMERHRSRMFKISLVGLIVVLLWVFAPRLISQLNKPSEIPSIPSVTSSLTNKTPTSLPTEITDAKGVSMVLVPAGEFTMGSNVDDAFDECQKYRPDCGHSWFDDESPPHDVYVDSFFIDKFEVTNLLYQACEDAGICRPPNGVNSYTNFGYYSLPKYDHYPVIYVTWDMARQYCEWREARLPTEAEWEKAARGTDRRNYPWGEGVNCNQANQADCGMLDTVEVGFYEGDKSPYGVYDMAGNVSEWVQDWYSDTYYQDSPSSNPLGPDNGEYRVLRGGSWNFSGSFLRSANRYSSNPVSSDVYYSSSVGFRCAKAATP